MFVAFLYLNPATLNLETWKEGKVMTHLQAIERTLDSDFRPLVNFVFSFIPISLHDL